MSKHAKTQQPSTYGIEQNQEAYKIAPVHQQAYLGDMLDKLSLGMTDDNKSIIKKNKDNDINIWNPTNKWKELRCIDIISTKKVYHAKLGYAKTTCE